MVIETERLVLKKLRMKDAVALSKIGNEYDVHYNSFFLMKFPFGKKEALDVINEEKKNMKRFGIFLKNKTLIGLIDLYNIKGHTPTLHSDQLHEPFNTEGKLKLGYWIGKNYRRKGYATEAIKKIIEYIFENFEIEKIIATTLITNEASMNLLEKLNFKKQKVLKNDRFLDGEYIDSVQFVLVRTTKPRV